jgi:hypothetical protein
VKRKGNKKSKTHSSPENHDNNPLNRVDFFQHSTATRDPSFANRKPLYPSIHPSKKIPKKKNQREGGKVHRTSCAPHLLIAAEKRNVWDWVWTRVSKEGWMECLEFFQTSLFFEVS